MLRSQRRLLLYARPHVRRFHSTPLCRKELFDPGNVERVSDDVDVCIVGAGPAGLSAAIRLKQLERERGRDIRVVVLEKGGEVGESGAPLPFPHSSVTPCIPTLCSSDARTFCLTRSNAMYS